MSGVNSFLFGSNGSTTQYDNLRPLSTWGTNAGNTYFTGATNEYNTGQKLINKGSQYLTDLYNNGTNSQVKSADAASAQLINTNTNKNFGSALAKAASNGVIDSTQFGDTASNIQSTGNQQLLSAHQQNYNSAANLGSNLVSTGESMTTPLQQGYTTERNFQASTPYQTVQTGASSGLLGSLLGSQAGTQALLSLMG